MFRLFLTAAVLFPCIAPLFQATTLQAQSPSTPLVGMLVDAVRLEGVEDVHLEGDYAYLPCREGKRLTICSIADPANPQVVSSFTHPSIGGVAGFALHDDIAYITSQGSGLLLIIDVKDKTAPKLLSSVPVGPREKGARGTGVLYKVAYRDGYCFVANLNAKKLFVVDVREPKQPVVISSVAVTEDNDGPFSITLLGDYALVGTIFGSRNRLAVVDVKEPAAPRLITQVFDTDVGHTSGEIIGRYFFSVNWDKNAFLVFDVSDPGNPKLKAKLIDKRLGNPNRCIVSGNRAYLPMVSGDGVAIVDISESENPKFVTSFHDATMKKTYGVAARGDLLFVGSRKGNSLVILNRGALEK